MASIASSRLSKIAAFSYCAIIIAALVERSDQVLSKRSLAECVGKCSRMQLKSLTRKVSKLRSSCYSRCLRASEAAQGQVLHRTQFFRQRTRKALPLVPGCPLSSPNQTVDWTPSKVSVSFGQYKNTSNWYANVSWTPLNDPNGSWSEIILRFFTKEKVPGRPKSGSVTCLKYPKHQTFVKLNISSYGYQYPNVIFLNIHGLPQSPATDSGDLHGYAPFTESSPTVTREVQTTKMWTWTTEFPDKTIVTTSVSVSLGVLVGVVFVACLLKYILNRKKRSKLPSEFRYHAFIIYNRADESWLTGELLPYLEGERHLKCCVHYRDFKVGIPYAKNMADSVYNSYKIIAVFSNNFLQSNYCIHELDLAKYRLVNERDDSLVIIRIDETDCSQLPRCLKKRSFIDYANVLERQFWKSRLLKFLDIPKDRDYESTRVEQDVDNNNSTSSDSVVENNQQRNTFHRLDSTNSTATVISFVANPDETFL